MNRSSMSEFSHNLSKKWTMIRKSRAPTIIKDFSSFAFFTSTDTKTQAVDRKWNANIVYSILRNVQKCIVVHAFQTRTVWHSGSGQWEGCLKLVKKNTVVMTNQLVHTDQYTWQKKCTRQFNIIVQMLHHFSTISLSTPSVAYGWMLTQNSLIMNF